MKPPFRLLLLALPLFFLAGCPVGTDYPLAKPGSEPFDAALPGEWEQTDREKEVVRFKVARVDAYSARLTVLEAGTTYALDDYEFTVWTTSVAGRTFVFMRPDTEDKYYAYCYAAPQGGLTTWDASLLAGGVDAVTSTDAYRKEITASSGLPDFLSSETVWEKVE